MENIFKYLDDTQYDNIYDRPFNELDLLILTELAYLSFDGLVASDLDLDKSKRLQDIAENYPQEQSMMHTRNRLKLLEKASKIKRFKNIKLMGFINDIDMEIEKQFAALVYCIQSKPATYVLAYRGTDDSIIGWKEDFHMTFMHEVPAQQSAHQYLEKRMTEYPGEYIVSGHSKGGNLAIYACSKLDEEKQNSVTGIYAFDAPGLHESLLESEGFLRIKDRIASYIPQDSMVSVLLEPPVNAKVVKSNAILLLQHDTFSWEVGQIDFVQIENQSQLSIHADKVISSWLDTMSNNEKQEFSDVIFDVFLESGINKFADITVDTPKKIINIVNNMTRLTSEQKKMTIQVFFKLFNAQFDVFKSYLPKPIQKVEGKVEHFAKSAFSNITGIFKKSKRKGK